LNTAPKHLLELGSTLGHISCEIEAGFGGLPQDIEGCIDEHDQIFIVQSRNQI
jgi:phosphoenolpyruvate synthase/pyruvate phosphate dikinase